MAFACGCQITMVEDKFKVPRRFLSREFWTYPPSPPSCEEGGNCEWFCEENGDRFFGVHGIIHSRKAIKAARDTNLQESHALPLSS